jgi:hypothetical protein
MPQASTSRAQLFYAAETQWGVTPTGPAPVMKELRFTGESLAHQKNTIQSAEIRQDGQVPDLIEVGASAGGNINYELSYGAYDDWLSALFHANWVDTTLSSLSITFTSGPKTIAATGIGATIVPGQYFRVQGATNPTNNGFFTAVIVAANSITVAETIVTEGPTAACKVDGSRLRNGIVEKSFTIEKLFSDLTSGQYVNMPGCEANTMSMNLQADQIISGVLGIIGKEGFSVSATVGSGTSAAPAFDVMNATSNIGTLLEGYPTMAALTTAIQQIQFTINTNLAGRRAIKSRGAIGIRQGRFVVTGNINAYFESGALYTKMISHGSSALHARVHDTPSAPSTGRSYFLTFPRIKFSNGDPVSPAVDQDVFCNLAFQAIRDPLLGITAQIDRFPTPP